MKRIGIAALGFVIAAVFAVSGSAQVPAAAQPVKIGLIDTGMFADEKEGIRKYIVALTSLDTEARPKLQELQTLQNRANTLAEEIRKLQNPPAGVPVGDAANQIRTKQDEGGRIQREFEFKKKEYDAFIEKRSGEVLGPINQDIGKAISEFAKQRGYAVVFDIDKLAQAGAILSLDESANITKAFIAFYNARPAAAATAANPR